MEIKVISTEADFTHIALIGKLDNLAVTEIEAQFLAETAERGQSAIIDVLEVPYAGSNGLRLFLRAVKALRPLKKRLILFNPNRNFHAMLLDSGIQDALSIETDLEKALAKAKA